MTTPDLPTAADVRMVAAVLAARYGGTPAVRDPEALAQALLRPHLRRHPDALSVAASLLEGFELQRPFVQHNHRVMLAVADAFLRVHRWRLAAPPEQVGGELVRMLRASAFEHAGLERWLRSIAVPEAGA